ncbi:dTDP-4-amino-4,6-dideoxy-D-galactose acyltransferase [Chitinophaga eiseniae]|uniref:dTDP-4-amino-4,6-dideoxy-D-galactose acyltransferase n=1 Tax=Chitinophaga eiseniae TaxID=634771 RepID=A0A1T4M7T1_9BACT|nr:GNAT family N-acetyltransferase [Chitinophaga eiseniae]SJZ63069.1 dTDP-4-amino-4,6-dideoxy-D-galactose acyltransferase [Chitinophaga eiseniae]
MMPYERLSWDSDFFGFEVYRIQHGHADVAQCLSALKGKARLVYLAAGVETPTTLLEAYNGRLVDIKTTFEKNVEGPGPLSPFISSYTTDPPEETLIRLGIESGVYSRFKVDDHFEEDQYKELYRLWVINSANRKIAREVLVYRRQEQLSGLITLGEKGGKGDIGLVAVDPASRGKGVGMALMAAAEAWSRQQGYHQLQVVTQGANTPACNLYQKCGFHIARIEYFYHFWL